MGAFDNVVRNRQFIISGQNICVYVSIYLLYKAYNFGKK